jgi:hypothetical protein
LARLPALRRWGPVLLAFWFALWSTYVLAGILRYGGIGGDALLYHRAAASWLQGGDAWQAAIVGPTGDVFHFYALPPTVVLLVPFSLLPEAWAPIVGIGIEAVAAVYVVRRLNLAWWWLLFPPLVSGVLAGNPSIVLLALLLASHPVLNALATTLKVYAGLPLLGEGRWRAITIGIALTLATVVLWPGLWAQFLTGVGAREAQLMKESNGGFSAYQYGLGITALVGAALLILAWFDRRAAGWLAPIAVWPASQFHWATLAMPLRAPWLAAVLAMHVQGLPVAAVLGYVLWRVLASYQHAPTAVLHRCVGRGLGRTAKG